MIIKLSQLKTLNTQVAHDKEVNLKIALTILIFTNFLKIKTNNLVKMKSRCYFANCFCNKQS